MVREILTFLLVFQYNDHRRRSERVAQDIPRLFLIAMGLHKVVPFCATEIAVNSIGQNLAKNLVNRYSAMNTRGMREYDINIVRSG